MSAAPIQPRGDLNCLVRRLGGSSEAADRIERPFAIRQAFPRQLHGALLRADSVHAAAVVTAAGGADLIE